jgi:hypothetical protein
MINFPISALLFSGSNNSIVLKREYYRDFACFFNLRYFPFDTQVLKVCNGKTVCAIDQRGTTGNISCFRYVCWCFQFRIKQIAILSLSKMDLAFISWVRI